MKFNFECWALCSIDINTDEEDAPTAKLLGFWSTRLAAEEGRDQIEMERLEAHAKSEAAYAKELPYMARIMARDFVPGRYICVPLSQMQFDLLQDAEEMICKAATLIHVGVGVQR